MHYLRKGLVSGMGSVLVAMLALGAGCSSSGDDDDGGGGESGQGSGGTGATGGGGGSGNASGSQLCGEAKCPAGQFCVSGVTCMPGCTTKDDCAADQICGSIDDLSHIGTCEDVTTKDCPGYLTKCEACGGGELCTQQVCDAFSLECVNCIAESNCDDSGDCPCD